MENISFKPEPRKYGSTIEKIYNEGKVPHTHQKLLDAFKMGLAPDTKGELCLQKVIDYLHITRWRAHVISRFLVKYGYIKYEADHYKHCIHVEILKGGDSN